VESLFFQKNVRTAITVGQARGVILLTLARGGLPVSEYTPMQVKQAVAGYGGAEKRQVQAMVRAILELAETPKPDDAADALAVAICHAHSYKIAHLRRRQSDLIHSRQRSANGDAWVVIDLGGMGSGFGSGSDRRPRPPRTDPGAIHPPVGAGGRTRPLWI